MSRSASLSYPIPVVGNGDDVACELPRLELEFRIVGTQLEIRPVVDALMTGSQTIDALVADGNAMWTLRVHCARTYFRQEFPLLTASDVTRIGTSDVEGDVTCDLQVVSTKEIATYRPEGMHADYADASFQVFAGDVLATIGSYSYPVIPRFDPMKADPRSLVQFERDTGESEGPFRVDLDGELIVVFIPESEWQLVTGLKDDVPELLHVCLALPALVLAIQGMSEIGETRRWAARLSAMLQARGLLREDPLLAAQRLLENPLRRGLGQLENALQSGGGQQ